MKIEATCHAYGPRRRRLIVGSTLAFIFGLISSVKVSQAFSPATHSYRKWIHLSPEIERTNFERTISLQATVAPEDQRASVDDNDPHGNKKPIIISSNFWGATIQAKTDGSEAAESSALPCLPSMDPTGFLPKGAYLTRNKADADKKKPQSSIEEESSSLSSSPCCRISLGIDLGGQEQSEMDPSLMVEQMQSMLEDGLTSFQIISPGTTSSSSLQAWGEEHVYGRFLKETPGTVRRRHAHLTIPFVLPQNGEDGSSFDPKNIRATVTDSLLRMGSFEALDCIQLFQPSALSRRTTSSSDPSLSYHLEILDVLKDLQREGLLVSVTGKNLSPDLIRSAASCGFEKMIDFNQLDLNLIDTTNYHNLDLLFLASEYDIPIQASSPLLGGLLTDEWALDRRNRFKQQHRTPRNQELSANAKRHLKTSIAKWSSMRSSDGSPSEWTRFSSEVWDVLEELSRKYDVAVTSIALRWLLQLKHVESAVVSTRLQNLDDNAGHGGIKYSRKSWKQQYRNTFRFSLDDEDVERLWEISGGPPPDMSDIFGTENGELVNDSELFAATADGLFLPSEYSGSESGKSIKSSGSLFWF